MINVQFPCLCERKKDHGDKNVGIKHCIGTRHRRNGGGNSGGTNGLLISTSYEIFGIRKIIILIYKNRHSMYDRDEHIIHGGNHETVYT